MSLVEEDTALPPSTPKVRRVSFSNVLDVDDVVPPGSDPCGNGAAAATTATTFAGDGNDPTEGVSPNSALRARQLRENLMRQQTGRDPLFYYEIVTVLGVGSMGSVAKVRKREDVIGGSSRKHLQKRFQREKRLRQCFEIPFLGGFFQYCLTGKTGHHRRDSSSGSAFFDTSGHSADETTERALLLSKGAIVEDYNDGHAAIEGEEKNKQPMYAMKSIHLSRVTDPSFVEGTRLRRASVCQWQTGRLLDLLRCID